jgi:glycosyltransferase involved in cell wall biosynthesis
MIMVSVCIGSVRKDTVGHVVDSVRRQTYPWWELIVVTQGTDAGLLASVDRAIGGDDRLRTLNIRQAGRSRALNVAIGAARGDVLAFIDDDCEAEADWLEVVAGCFGREPRVGIVAGDLVPPPRRPFELSTCPAAHTSECIYRPADLGYQAPEGFYFAGGNMAVRRSVVELVGPFDEYLGPGTPFPSSEDLDFALRCEERDVWMQTTPRSRVRHTFGRRSGLRAVMRHHRGYALGQGAFSGKLALWGHRLSQVWGAPASATDRLRAAVLRPATSMKALYQARHIQRGRARYLRDFEIDERRLSTPRQGDRKPAATSAAR